MLHVLTHVTKPSATRDLNVNGKIVGYGEFLEEDAPVSIE
jgi:hypothetical protein